MTAQTAARSVRSVPPSARAIGRATSARGRAARWADVRHLTPYEPARLADLFRLLGRKLTPTAVRLVGWMRRARRQGFAGLALTVEQLAHLCGCSERTVQRNLRLLERLRLFRVVEQYEDIKWTDGARRYERRQVASVYLFGEVGRFTCDTKPPAPATRVAFRELARPAKQRPPQPTKCHPNDSSRFCKQNLPESARAPTPEPRKAVSPSATSDPVACRRPQSNASATPAAAGGELAAPGAGRAFGEERPPPVQRRRGVETPPAGAWLSLCPEIAASTERDGPPTAAAPSATGRARRGDS